MSTILTQAEFEHCAAAWADTLQRASLYELQQLFGPAGKSRQAYVSFDLATSITSLLSTVSIAGVNVRFVLHKKFDSEGPAHFGVVLCATDALGGRISAYYLNDPEPAPIPPHNVTESDEKQKGLANKSESFSAPDDSSAADGGDTDTAGQVPFNLIKTWVDAWANAPQLNAAMFQTHYGPLQGYNFQLSDFVEPLFQAKTFAQKSLRVLFDLKTYYPAYPENPTAPTQTFGLVLRLYPPVPVEDQFAVQALNMLADLKLLSKSRPEIGALVTSIKPAAGGAGSGGSSYDMSNPIPPGV